LLFCENIFRVSDYPSGFEDPRISGSGMNFNPNQCSGRVWVLISGFGFGCPDNPPDPNPPRCHLYSWSRLHAVLLSPPGSRRAPTRRDSCSNRHADAPRTSERGSDTASGHVRSPGAVHVNHFSCAANDESTTRTFDQPSDRLPSQELLEFSHKWKDACMPSAVPCPSWLHKIQPTLLVSLTATVRGIMCKKKKVNRKRQTKTRS